MSHFTVMVIGDNPEKQLAPYQENNMGDCPEEFMEFDDQTESLKSDWEAMSEKEKEEYGDFESFVSEDGYEEHEGLFGYWTNKNCKWDWYQLGGRWSGFLKMKPNTEGTVGTAGLFAAPASKGTADSAIKRDIDFSSMREEAEKEAGKIWDKAKELLEGTIVCDSWEHVREVMFPGEIEKAREYYNNQQGVKILGEYKDADGSRTFGWGTCPTKFNVTREAYCKKAGDESIVTFAILKDGKWYERGSMGWWGIVSDEKDSTEWSSEVAKMVEELSDDTLISIYDCHI
jgi:hypothetical protein